MKIKLLAAIALSAVFAGSVAFADQNDNVGSLQGPMLADAGNNAMSGAAAPGSSNMSGTSSNNMSGTQGNNMSGTGTMGGSGSPSDEGGADTATGDDY